MEKARASATACMGPAPPKARSVQRRPSTPRSTVTRRSARSMVESATRTTPSAAASTLMPIADASGATAARAAARSTRMSPPMTRSGAM